MRELGADRAKLLVCVFGRNLAKAQEKRSFLTSALEEQVTLSEALQRAFDYKQP